ncbi:MAG: MoaD/ThiS family protein [Betaproteobacteria bacterium]|nr:MoaD/ThiS family protein [Betaproteobacteria bacterium]
MKVRWDAVVGSSRFWTEPPRPAVPARSPDKESAGPVTVNVWLYGSLASVAAERPLALELPSDFTVGEVLAQLGQRYGEEFSHQVIGADGRKLRHCRVFVNGLPADDPEAPVHAGPSPALVEMILLTAIEGG